MKRCALLLAFVVSVGLVVGCARRKAPPPKPPVTGAVPLAEAGRELILEEGGGGGAGAAAGLQALLAHFDLKCSVVDPQTYRAGQLNGHQFAFYLAAGEQGSLPSELLSDLSVFEGTAVWVGPGVARLGEKNLAAMGIRAEAEGGSTPEEQRWSIGYGGQEHVELVGAPAVETRRGARTLSAARLGGMRRPFMAGQGKRWYAAAPPRLDREHVWTACVWADALHEMLGMPHEHRRRLIPVLREVPVWTVEEQVPKVVGPMLRAKLPVAVLAKTQWQEASLSERPGAVAGLRRVEEMGASVVLEADDERDAREQLRLAWEVGLHPVAWSGPEGRGNPFNLRVASREGSPPFNAGGLLPAPIAISDAGYYAAEDMARLEMQEVVRDAVALVSFSLWAVVDPFRGFVRGREARGWERADIRELGVQIVDERRAVVSGRTTVRVAWGTRVTATTVDSRWRETKREAVRKATSRDGSLRTIVAPEGHLVLLGAERGGAPARSIKGVTLDPAPYANLGLSAKTLAETLAERYSRNGVNTVFFYVYNVKEGAAYRTRFPGATVSDWGRQDLLKHMLEACHARDIQVVAWMYSGRDRYMWWKHPEWRERRKNGKVYNPLRLHAAHFLCPRNGEVREWYWGLVTDLGKRYPKLDGIELCEPLVNWFGNEACYCDACRESFAAEHAGKALGGEEWRQHRSEGMTEFMSGCLRAIAEVGIESYVLTICDAWDNGALLTPRRQAEESGFDLEALMDGPYPPDWVNFEIIWQQWANIYNPEVFGYEWAEETAKRLKSRVDGRGRMLVHVEITDFGKQRMTPEKTAETIRRVMRARPAGVECYHSAALDRKSAWAVMKRAYEEIE